VFRRSFLSVASVRSCKIIIFPVAIFRFGFVPIAVKQLKRYCWREVEGGVLPSGYDASSIAAQVSDKLPEVSYVGVESEHSEKEWLDLLTGAAGTGSGLPIRRGGCIVL